MKDEAVIIGIVILSGILSLGVHEVVEYSQAKQHPWVEPVNFTVAYPQMGWSMEWQFEPTSEQVEKFMEDSKDWHRKAVIVQIISVFITFALMLGLYIWWGNG